MSTNDFVCLTRRELMRRATFMTVGGMTVGLLRAPGSSATSATTGASVSAAFMAQEQGGELRWPLDGDPVPNPVVLPSPLNSSILVKLMYNNLVKYDGNFNVVADLATAWEASSDVRSWRFTLQSGVTWHDGEPFTAEDVKFSLEIHKNPEVNSYYGSYFAILDRVDVIDPTTVEVHCTEPYGSLLEILAFNVAMLPQHLLIDQDMNEPVDYLQNPVGTGPFRYGSAQSGSFYQVVANPDYFGGRPLLDTVTLNVIPEKNTQIAQVQAGELDFTTLTPQQGESTFQGNAEVEVREVPLIMHVILPLLNSDPRFEDIRVRRALAMAIDRQTVVDQLLLGKGQVATGPIVPVIEWAYPEDIEPLPFDPDQAIQLLTEAGWEAGAGGMLERNGEPFRFAMTYWSSANTTDLAPVIQQYLLQIGIDVQLDLLEFATAVEKVRGKNYEAALYWWVTPADPDLTNYYGTGGTSNIAGYSNPTADDLLAQARAVVDRSERAALYREFQQLMVDEQPVVFLHYPLEIQAVAERVEGMPSVHFRDVMKFAPEFWINEG